MRFKRVNYKNLRLRPGDKISPSYIRLVEKDSKLYQMVQKTSENIVPEEAPKSTTDAKKDFLATALENCQKFNEDFEGSFDKA